MGKIRLEEALSGVSAAGIALARAKGRFLDLAWPAFDAAIREFNDQQQRWQVNGRSVDVQLIGYPCSIFLVIQILVDRSKMAAVDGSLTTVEAEEIRAQIQVLVKDKIVLPDGWVVNVTFDQNIMAQ